MDPKLLCIWHGNTSSSNFPDPATEQHTSSRQKAVRDYEHLRLSEEKNTGSYTREA
jgi:hypothetical protein